jgi:lipoteichoic acid synthase
MVVVIGDHDAGFDWETSPSAAIGIPTDAVTWRMQDRVPWLIHIPGADAPRAEISRAAGQLDIAPTLLALLGVDPASLPYMGRNLLGSPDDSVIVRPYGGWVAGPLFFDSDTGPPERCYEISTRAAVPFAECGDGVAQSARMREVSTRVLTYDLQTDLAK